jgi:hypothetical protein
VVGRELPPRVGQRALVLGALVVDPAQPVHVRQRAAQRGQVAVELESAETRTLGERAPDQRVVADLLLGQVSLDRVPFLFHGPYSAEPL